MDLLAAIPDKMDIAPSMCEAARLNLSSTGIPKISLSRKGSPPQYPPSPSSIWTS